MGRFTEFLRRGLFLRCPRCGQGKLFQGWFRMYKECPVCHFVYEREEGYFSSSMAINLVISELIVTAIVLPLAANPAIPVLPVLLWCAPLPFILPLLFYRHSRSMWMSMDHYMNPPVGRGLAGQPTPVQEPREQP